MTHTIKVGDWVEFCGERRLAYRVVDGVVFTVNAKGGIGSRAIVDVTPLPDCTGWDWQPPPKYRPFKDAVELLKHSEFRRIKHNSVEYGIGLIDLRTNVGVTVARLWDKDEGWTPWFSTNEMLSHCTFADTGEPCGVKL